MASAEARRRPPVWTARPSRFAGLTKPRALTTIGIAVLLMLGGLVTLWGGMSPPADALFAEAAVRAGLTGGIRAGGDYYSVAQSVFRADPSAIGTWDDVPLPIVALAMGALSPFAAFIVQLSLLIAVFVAWCARLWNAFGRLAALGAAALLLAGGLAVAIDPLLGSLGILWSGLLIALALALWRPDRWVEPVAIGLMACVFDEAALLFLAVMGVFAIAEARRREATGWLVAALVFAALFVAHGLAVGDIAPAARMIEIDPVGGGQALFLQSVALSTTLHMLPIPLAAILITTALLGWASWNDPVGLRILALMAAQALIIALLAPADAVHWALLIAPLVPLGLVFAPDAIRDLAAALLDRRRVRVQRITR